MFISTNFSYDGINNEDMGIYLVRLENGMLEVPTMKQSVLEEKTNYKDIGSFYGINRESMSFPLVFAKINQDDLEFTYEERVKILRWLCKSEYKEFISEDNKFIRYYMLFEEVKRFDNYNNQGYLTLNCRLNAPYGFSPIINQMFDLSDNESTTIIELENKSNIIDNYFPEIEITLVDDSTEFSIKNISSYGDTFTMDNLSVNEKVYINMDTGKIKSSTNLPRISKSNKKWIGLVYGKNYIEVTGKCIIQVRSQFPMVI